MKKSLLAVAVAAALPAVAQAQSSVTLFGILDAGIQWSNDEANSTVAPTGVVTRNEDTFRLFNGTHSGSRFGVRGSEDIGGGLRAIFTLEHRFSVDTGAVGSASSFWNGQAWVGLAGGWGQLTMGRQYTPIFWSMLPADFTGYSFYNNWAFFHDGFTAVPIGSSITPIGPLRADNSLAYRSPTFGGLTIYAMYAFGEAVNGAVGNGFGGGSGDQLAVSAGWQIGGLYVGAGYHTFDQDAVGQIENVLAATVSYKFTNFGLSAGYTVQEFIGGAELKNILVSAFANLGPGTLFLSAMNLDPSGFAGVRNDTALQYGITYSMPLSKRTNWYVSYGANDISGIQPAASTVNLDGIQRVAIGLRHLF